MIDKKKLRELQRQGYTHVVTHKKLDGTITIISAHNDYEPARRALHKNKKGNSIYEIKKLLA